jgi:hypothetical protein
MNFISLKKELPPANTLLVIKRNDGGIYVGYRTGKPLSTNPDASRDCYWWANKKANAFSIESGKLEFHNNFSDVTVDSWAYLSIDETTHKPEPACH